MLLKLIFLLLIILMMLIPTKHALHMFQQNRYELRRYGKWLNDNVGKNVLLGLIIALVLVIIYYMVLRSIVPYLSYFIIAAITVYDYLKEKKKSYIKPLVYTARVKRQIVVIVLLDLLILGSVIWFTAIEDLMGLVVIAYVMNWLMIYPMGIITMPLEKGVQLYFINDAKKILRKHDDLIKIGITGSYGKTSSKNIVQAIISDRYRSLMTPASFNTPMGITITIREHLKPTDQVFVCEMGADKVNDISYLCKFVKPQIGLVTSIGPQHLQTFKTLDNIIKEKMQMIECLPKDGLGIINVDNEHIRNYQVKNSCKLVTYGIYHDADYQAVDIQYGPDGSSFNVLFENEKHAFKTKLLGEHNIMNILASIAIARHLGIGWQELMKSVRQVDYVEHRLQVKKINGYTFIDNAFNSNPEGAAMSLKVMSMMPNKRFIVTPGLIDLGPQQYAMNYDLGKKMLGMVDVVILVGPNQTLPIFNGLQDSGFDMENVYVVQTVKEAFSKVYAMASLQDVILLENDLPDAFNK